MMEALGRAVAKRDSETGAHNYRASWIASGMGWRDGANAIVAAHHEKWNGTGYPRGPKGEDIPLVTRIFALADVFDALCSKRPYKEPLSLDAAMAILEKDTGSSEDDARALL
jgi:HD-GYP domain-containing protein (c-di-GMP phosphodiesterase class II)